jgi:mono/diheme cytochrome c family protein
VGLIALVAVGCGGESASRAGAGAAAQPAPPAASDPRAVIFVAKGCPQCHSISALGVSSPTNVGPDLTQAVTDVQSRFNTTLEAFLENPTGTMQIVLGSQIQLSPAERDSIVRLLRALNSP